MNNSKKTIWYCHHYAGSPSRGMSYRPYYLTREFCEAGHNAFVISASYHHLQHGEKQKSASSLTVVKKMVNNISLRALTNQFKTVFTKMKSLSSLLNKLKIKPVIFKSIDNVPFILLKTNYYRKSLGRILNMLSYSLRFYLHHKAIVKLTGQPDVIIVSSSHPFHYPVLEKIAKKYQAKLIFEVRDLWPASLVELLKIHRFHPLVLLLSSIERRAYRRADQVVSLLENALPYMQKYGLDAERFHVIPNGTSIALFGEKKSLSLELLQHLQEIKCRNNFILGYAGALGVPNAMQYLVSAMGQIAEKKLPIHCVIVGDGALKKQLQEHAESLGLKNITFLSPIPKYQIPAFLHEMDALYLGWLNSEIYTFGVSPNKLFDYMMSGKPIIESIRGDLSLVKRLDCGIQCEPEDPQAIAEAIISLFQLPQDLRERMGQVGTASVKAQYDYKILARKYLKLW